MATKQHQPVLNLTEPLYPMDECVSPARSPYYATFPPLERSECTMHCLTGTNDAAAIHGDAPQPAYCYACLYRYQDWLCQQTLAYTFSWSDLPCAKLSNIPWDVSQQDILQFFSHVQLPSGSAHAQSVHILMDRTTGKTLSDAYVEFASLGDLYKAVKTRHQRLLKGRVVSVVPCQQDELLRAVFPKWRGKFAGQAAVPPDQKTIRSMSTAAGGGSDGSCPLFITREEINSLLVVCKNYKLHFSKKCVERPFENIISVVTKYPWHQADLITVTHRNLVFDMLRLAIVTLKKNHLVKNHVQVNPTLLDRLVRAGLLCAAFTQQQKSILLQAARMDCPMDLACVFMLYDQAWHAPTMAAASMTAPMANSYDVGAMDAFHYSPTSSTVSSSPSASSSTSTITSTSYQHDENEYLTMTNAAATRPASFPPHHHFHPLQLSSQQHTASFFTAPHASKTQNPIPSSPWRAPAHAATTDDWTAHTSPVSAPNSSSVSRWNTGFSQSLFVLFVKESNSVLSA